MTADTIPGFPLQWPAGWKRIANREAARFSQGGGRVTVNEGRVRVLRALERMAILADDVVVSTNVPLRLDGMPRSGAGEPDDPGVAVYWIENRDGLPRRCIAVDRYSRVADNLAAVAATLDAMRAIERHGGAEILDRAFTGFVALPPPPRTAPDWQDVLGLQALLVPTLDDAREAYRRLAAEAHPDRPGGDSDRMARINAAWNAAQEELQPMTDQWGGAPVTRRVRGSRK